ncbi:hypothetical protein [Paucibacter sp. DJ2R-2]|uniref:hypothetical protein n=1 Tax=Paucibacter sp. DJ2R-2 TaxID=2893558 RepID=UPI0021E3BEB5|nr:hypothetical protein [Paucibacter sp. DJ2R-2]MCV2420314.1 hypothetical protein [Paucibacter sp. DJ4R-1]MCV2436741.1 hypothetical protein [Paucibacter sp. DJ2R-2]
MIEALVWPGVSLILGLVAIGAFRGPLVRKIDRITRATKEGISFEQPQVESKPKGDTLSFDDLMKQPISNAVLEREKFISGKLREIAFKTDAERIAVLMRALASVGVDSDFYKVAHVIFGSQVSFLVQLSGTQQGLPKQVAVSRYTDAKLAFPEIYATRSFEQWIGYLLNINLVRIDGDSYDITQHGSDFLKYLVDARLAHDRNG